MITEQRKGKVDQLFFAKKIHFYAKQASWKKTSTVPGGVS